MSAPAAVPESVFAHSAEHWDGRRTQAASAFGTELLLDATGWFDQTHSAFSRRAFGLTGPGATPIRDVHDGMARIVFASVRLGIRAAGGVGHAAGYAQHVRGVRTRAPRGPASPKVSVTLAALNGIVGDRLARNASPLALKMSLHDSAGLPVCTPLRQRRLAVLVHGLCQSERAWHLRRPRDAQGAHPTYLHALEAAGWTPLVLRYNSGLSLTDNAAELAHLLERLLDHQPPDDLALIGHSMGGLVARIACQIGRARQHRWVEQVSHLAYLGSPHEGAPLARAATRGSRLAARLPETAALTALLEYRSEGIRDLDHGLSTSRAVDGAAEKVPLLSGARHLVVAGALGRSCESRSARVLGDLLVPPSSACGGTAAAELGFDADATHRLPRISHLRLLNDARVEELLLAHLELPRPASDQAVVDQV